MRGTLLSMSPARAKPFSNSHAAAGTPAWTRMRAPAHDFSSRFIAALGDCPARKQMSMSLPRVLFRFMRRVDARRGARRSRVPMSHPSGFASRTNVRLDCPEDGLWRLTLCGCTRGAANCSALIMAKPGAPKQPSHFARRKIWAQIEGQTDNDLSIKENG